MPAIIVLMGAGHGATKHGVQLTPQKQALYLVMCNLRRSMDVQAKDNAVAMHKLVKAVRSTALMLPAAMLVLPRLSLPQMQQRSRSAKHGLTCRVQHAG